MASQVVLMVKNPPANAGDIRSLGEGKGHHSNILVWSIPWTEEPAVTVQRVANSQTQLKQLSMHACDLLCKAQGRSHSFLKPPGVLHCPIATVERLTEEEMHKLTGREETSSRK